MGSIQAGIENIIIPSSYVIEINLRGFSENDKIFKDALTKAQIKTGCKANNTKPLQKLLEEFSYTSDHKFEKYYVHRIVKREE